MSGATSSQSGRCQQALFRRAQSQRQRRLDGRSFALAGLGVQAGGDIHRQDRKAAAVDGLDELPPILIERAIEADAKEGIHDPPRGRPAAAWEKLRELSQSFPRVVHIGQQHLAIRQIGLRGARVVAVMAFAGDEPEGVAGPGQLEKALRQEAAYLLDDLRPGFAGGPSGLFPLAHLLDRNDRNLWHA
jgi:hypothetical protein